MVSLRKVLLRAIQKIQETERSRYCFTWKITPFPSTKRKKKIQASLKESSSRDKNLLNPIIVENSTMPIALKLEKLLKFMEDISIFTTVMITPENFMKN